MMEDERRVKLIQHWEGRGAEARARGASQIECPLFAADQLPVATRETTEEWALKAEAWLRGWTIEDAIGQMDSLLAGSPLPPPTSRIGA
jgi:hypothetical protein